METILWNLASFIVALGILVAVHEFGHFWVARLCGVKVERFSIGLGKAIWTRVGKDGTEYSLSMIPLGGYVAMLNGRYEKVPEELKEQDFAQKPLWQRTAIIAAGPIFNFIFAIAAYWLMFMIGVSTLKPIVGEVTPNSIVAKAGIESGMELKAISGIQTPSWDSVNMQIIGHIGHDSMTLTVSAPNEVGSEKTVSLDLTDWHFDPEQQLSLHSLGFEIYRPEVLMTVAAVTKGQAAEQAGLLSGDKFVSINGQTVSEWQEVVEAIRSHPLKAFDLQVERDGQIVDLTLVPGKREISGSDPIGFAGIAPEVAEWPQGYRFNMQYGVFESLGRAIEQSGQVIDLTAAMIKKLIVGDVGLNNLSGPISIAKGAGATADSGLVYFLGFLALISINLGVINLVPLPMLDGGHLLFFAIEAVTRRPVSLKVQEACTKFGFAVIISLMALAIINDFTRL